MTIPSPPFYHGSSETGVKDIISNGVDLGKVQSRDRGFFGDGFYVAQRKDIARQHATTVGPNNPAIVEIDIDNSARILFAGETFSKGSIKPSQPPSWHPEFIDWSLQKVKNAAVWEYATDKSEEEIMESAERQRTPGSGVFDRQNWYQEVTEFAESKGYDVVYWTDGEIILKNTDVVTRRERVE